jgi:hypothetical protein
MLLWFTIFLSLCPSGTHICSSYRNLRPMLVVTFVLYGGLYHVTLRILLLAELLLYEGLYLSVCLYPLSDKAFWYGCTEFLNSSSLVVIWDSLWLMLSGMFLMIAGGWLLSECTYKGVLLGFMNGLWYPVLKSKFISRKSADFLLASIVMRSLCFEKVLHNRL